MRMNAAAGVPRVFSVFSKPVELFTSATTGQCRNTTRMSFRKTDKRIEMMVQLPEYHFF